MSKKFDSTWTELNFIEREMLSPMDERLLTVGPIKWIEFPKKEKYEWASDANSLVMDFGGVFNSIYLRWAFAVNGLHVARDRYSSDDWIKSPTKFNVIGIRNATDGSGPRQEVIFEPDNNVVGELHGSTIPMLSSWAFCNMYACLEEFIFKIFRVYLESNPNALLKGKEFKEGRNLYRNRNNSEACSEIWKTYWNDRLEKWHRKRLYDGIEKVFNSFISQTGLKIPKAYEKDYDYSDVAKTLGGIALIRNCFVHGATEVPQELEAFCSDFRGLFFSYKTGEKFEITLHELATFEFQTSTFLQGLNQSLFELVYPEIANLTKVST